MKLYGAPRVRGNNFRRWSEAWEPIHLNHREAQGGVCARNQEERASETVPVLSILSLSRILARQPAG